jgi:hypothetical protein
MTSTRILIPLALVAVAGCGSDDGANPTAKAPAAAVSSAPYGSYLRQVTKADIQRTNARRDEHGPYQSPPSPGRGRLVIARGSGGFDIIKVSDTSGFTIAMDVKATAGRLDFVSYVDPTKGSFCGPEIPAQAKYEFTKRNDGSLALQPVGTDPCADRDSTLTGTWKKP